MSSRPPHIVSLMRSSSNVRQRPRSNRNPAISSAHPTNSHYHDLRQLEPEEDLIELNSRPSTPRNITEHFDELVPGHQSDTSTSDSDHRLRRYHTKQYVTQQNVPLLVQAFDRFPVIIVFKYRQVFSTLKTPSYREIRLSELIVCLVQSEAGRSSIHMIYCIQPLIPCSRHIC